MGQFERRACVRQCVVLVWSSTCCRWPHLACGLFSTAGNRGPGHQLLLVTLAQPSIHIEEQIRRFGLFSHIPSYVVGGYRGDINEEFLLHVYVGDTIVALLVFVLSSGDATTTERR
jgi:hypothetical protein